MAPEQGAQEAIRKALAMGADRAVLISDPALHGTDMWGTGHVLAQALKKLHYDLILSGSQSSDAGRRHDLRHHRRRTGPAAQSRWINRDRRWRTAWCAASAAATWAST